MIDETEAYGLTFRFPARDTAVGASLRDHGEFARPELDFLLAQAGASDGTFVDVGAHIGSVSLPFAKARPGWRVISVEAAHPLANLIVESAAKNGLGNVEVLSVAAGEAAGIADYPAVELANAGNFGSIGFGHEGGPRRKIGVRPLDDIAPDDTRLVKLDVEGFEAAVLRGARRLVETVRPVWLIETHRKHLEDTRPVAEQLGAQGYRLLWFFSPFATPSAPKGPPAEPGRGDLGVVAVPPGREAAWDLPPIVDLMQPPGDDVAFPYLRRYGYPVRV